MKNKMTKEEFKIDSNNMFYLVAAVYMDYKTRGKTCPYENLLEQVDTYKMNGTLFNPKIHKIDDFMVDAYRIYDKFSEVEDKIGEVLDMSNLGKFFGLDEKKIRKELQIISKTFEDLMINCDFEGVEIRGIQKNFLKDIMKNAVEEENYEFCGILKTKINNI